METIRIATRKSPLALWQAEEVAKKIKTVYPNIKTELIAIVSEGDKRLDMPLASFGGKGLFLKELEQSLMDGQSDIAVHSMKDVPAELPQGLEIVSVLERGDPSDALVSNDYASLDDLPRGAVVGTSSSRRKSQLLKYRPDLDINDLRGNLATRLGKLDEGKYQAIVLASAGLKRLGMEHRISQALDHSVLLPAIGQGTIAIECLGDNLPCISMMSSINHMPSWLCALAERSCGEKLEADCHMPVAVHANFNADKRLQVKGIVSDLTGTESLFSEVFGSFAEAQALGHRLADKLLSQGANKMLNK